MRGWTVAEAARRVNVSEKTLRRWLKAGYLTAIVTHHRRGSGVIRYLDPRAVARVVASRRLEVPEFGTQETKRPPARTLATVPLVSPLPDGLVSLRAFITAHGIPSWTVWSAVRRGHLRVARGRWKAGRQYVEIALDAEGRATFAQLWRARPDYVCRCEQPH